MKWTCYALLCNSEGYKVHETVSYGHYNKDWHTTPCSGMQGRRRSPLPGGDLPGGISPPEMGFLFCRFPPRGGGKTWKLLSFRGFYPRGSYRRKGAPRGATRHPGGCLARPGRGRARHPSGCLVGLPTSSFGGSQSFPIKMTSVNFQLIWTCSASATWFHFFTAEFWFCCSGTGKLQTV